MNRRLKEAKREQQLLVAEYRAGNKTKQLIAEAIADCRQGHRCNLRLCPVCNYRRNHGRISDHLEITVIGGFGVRVGIEDIVVGKRRRPLDQAKVAFIAASMRQVGQLVPVIIRVVKKKVILVSGWHRLAAAESLGWETILCMQMVGDKDDPDYHKNAYAAEIAENLHRVELTALQWADMINDWRKFVIEQGGQVAPRGGRQPQDLGIKKTAKALGLTREEIRRAMKIARLSDKAKVAAIELGLDKNQAALLEMAKQPTEEGQLKALEDIVVRQRMSRNQRLSDSEKQTREAISKLESEIINEEQALEALTEELSEKRKHLRSFKRDLASQGSDVSQDFSPSPPTSPDDTPAPPTSFGPDRQTDDNALNAMSEQWQSEGILQREKWDSASIRVRREFLRDVLSPERDQAVRLR